MEVILVSHSPATPSPRLRHSNPRCPADRETAIKGAEARGHRTPDGFVVLQGSTAVLQERPSAQERHPYVVVLRKQLLTDGTLVQKNGFLVFTKDTEFSSPSAAAAVVHGGGSNGLTEWKTQDGSASKVLR
jgi:hypothetical protein